MQPHTSYLVCGTPRSGSSLLCEALATTGIAGRPEEYFQPTNEMLWQERWGIATYAEYLARVIEQCTTPNGVFGVKMMWGYFDHFLHHMQQMPDYKKKTSVHTMLQLVFPNLQYIWIRRRDTLRQAVSHAKALQTNQWVVKEASSYSSGDPCGRHGSSCGRHAEEYSCLAAHEPVFSFLQIDFLLQEINAQNAAWRRFFIENGVQPLVIIYEDFVASYEKTVRATLQCLGIPGVDRLPVAPVSMKKQADEQSEQWVQRYLGCKSQARYRLVSQANSYLLSFLRAIRPGTARAGKRT